VFEEERVVLLDLWAKRLARSSIHGLSGTSLTSCFICRSTSSCGPYQIIPDKDISHLDNVFTSHRNDRLTIP
jgi:hypothetical protein